MKNLIEFLPAAIAIAAVMFVVIYSIIDANHVDLDENKIESN